MLPLVAEAEYIHIVSTSLEPGEFPGKVFDMNASSPVSMGRILIAEENNFHESSPDKASFFNLPLYGANGQALAPPGMLGRFHVS